MAGVNVQVGEDVVRYVAELRLPDERSGNKVFVHGIYGFIGRGPRVAVKGGAYECTLVVVSFAMDALLDPSATGEQSRCCRVVVFACGCDYSVGLLDEQGDAPSPSPVVFDGEICRLSECYGVAVVVSEGFEICSV